MDYNVQYHIDINGAEASGQLSAISQQVQRLMPPMINYFRELNRVIGKCNSGMAAMQKVGKMPKLDINASEAFKKINTLKSEIQKLRSTTINLRVNERSVNSPGSHPVRRPRAKTGGDSGDGSFGYYRSRLGTTGLLTALGVPYAGMFGTVALGRGATHIVKASVEYEHTMDLAHSILKSHDGDLSTFQSRFEEMSRHMRQIGIETQFTATQIADATKFLAMAGLNVAQIDAAMKPVANLAVIGDSDLGQMADLVTNIVTGYGIKNQDISAASDIMAAVSTGANTTVTEMAEAFKYAAGQLSVAGISFNEASAAIGILGNAGMKATVAGTGLRAMMMRMVNPTRKAQKVLDALGISFTKLDKNGKPKIKSLQEAFEDLHKAGAGLKELNTIFDKTASKAAIALMVNVENFKKLTGESIHSFGIAEALAAKRQDTVKGLWYQISSQFTEDGMQVFEAMTPLIKGYMRNILKYLKTPEAIQMIRDTVNVFRDLFNILVKIVGVIINHWDKFKVLFIGGFLSRKIYQVGSGILGLSVNILELTKSLKGLSTFTQGKGGTSVLGWLGKIGVKGSIISALIGGGLLAYNHVQDNDAQSEDAFSSWAKVNDISLFASPIPQKYKQTKKQTLYDKYERELSGDGNGGAFERATNNYNLNQGKARYQYNRPYARAAAIAQAEANNKWHEIHKDIVNRFTNARSAERGNIMNEAIQKQKHALDYTSFTFRNHDTQSALKSMPHGSKLVIPTVFGERELWFQDPGLMPASHLSNTVEIGEQIYKRYGETLDFLKPLNKILSMPEGQYKALSMLYFFDKQTGLNFNKIRDNLIPAKDEKGNFIFELAENGSREAVQEYITKTNELLSKTHGDGPLKKWWSSVPIHNNILSNNLGSGIDNVDVSGLDTDFSSSGGGNGGMSGTGSSLRHITVHIDKLMSVDSMSVNTDEDIDAFKEKLKKALIDVVKDVEISY